MAQGDITKQIEYDKIEVVNKWTIQVRQATLIMEEQADGSKKEINRTFHRHTLKPFLSLFKKIIWSSFQPSFIAFAFKSSKQLVES